MSILFFVSGFLLTYSLLSTEFDGKAVGTYYAKRIFKLMPYNIFVLMFANYFAPTVGTGPHYINIEKALAGCKTYWWTNVLYINNIYPANYDDKCLPQTWFLACFVQMSLIVPLIVGLFRMSSLISRIFMGLLITAMWATILGVVIEKDIGMFPFNFSNMMFDHRFYNDIFMMPYYQLPVFLVGSSFALIYSRFLSLREGNDQEVSYSLKLLNALTVKRGVRYAMYTVGTLIFFAIYFGIWGYNAYPNKYPMWVQGIYASTAPIALVLAVSCFVVPALIGRAELVRFIFGGSFWQVFSYCALGLSMLFPIECLTYYMGIQQSSNLEYYMMLYDYIGNFVFAFVFALLTQSLIDKPFQAIFYIQEEFEIAQKRFPNAVPTGQKVGGDSQAEPLVTQ